MNITKAIEILQVLNDRQKGIWFVGENEATQLGIEALKQAEEVRNILPHPHWQKLPGETTD